jgi:hypothetical protein
MCFGWTAGSRCQKLGWFTYENNGKALKHWLVNHDLKHSTIYKWFCTKIV